VRKLPKLKTGENPEDSRETLPPGKRKDAGYERRQIFDLEIKRRVTEYRAERPVNEGGEYRTAEFPEGPVQAAQYGNGVKARGVYMSVEQPVPRGRVSEHFDSQMNLPVSAGSIRNFRKEAHTCRSGKSRRHRLTRRGEGSCGQIKNKKSHRTVPGL
jgi:transposase